MFKTSLAFGIFLTLFAPTTIYAQNIPPYPQDAGPEVIRDEFENPEASNAPPPTSTANNTDTTTLTGNWRIIGSHFTWQENNPEATCRVDTQRGEYETQISIVQNGPMEFTVSAPSNIPPFEAGNLTANFFGAWGGTQSHVKWIGAIIPDAGLYEVVGVNRCGEAKAPFEMLRIF